MRDPSAAFLCSLPSQLPLQPSLQLPSAAFSAASFAASPAASFAAFSAASLQPRPCVPRCLWERARLTHGGAGAQALGIGVGISAGANFLAAVAVQAPAPAAPARPANRARSCPAAHAAGSMEPQPPPPPPTPSGAARKRGDCGHDFVRRQQEVPLHRPRPPGAPKARLPFSGTPPRHGAALLRTMARLSAHDGARPRGVQSVRELRAAAHAGCSTLSCSGSRRCSRSRRATRRPRPARSARPAHNNDNDNDNDDHNHIPILAARRASPPSPPAQPHSRTRSALPLTPKVVDLSHRS